MPSCPQLNDKLPFQRLPKTVLPQVYNIRLKPDLQKFTFEGEVDIDVTVLQATNIILLNALELEFNSVSFTRNGNEVKAKEWSINKDTEIASIVFSSPIEPGIGNLSIKFTGILNDKLHGFYRTQYTTLGGEVRYAATTQFEATHAREAFPCWDEPAIKAQFNVTLVVPKDRVALSNMSIIAKEPDTDASKKVVKFDVSPIMSTYLVAFIVGEYDFIEDVTPNGIKVRMYTPLGKSGQGKFALNVAVRAIPFFEKYFDVPCNLKKVDLIAIADFEAGAMENWGLLTFRETRVLFDEKNSSTLSKQMVALVVSHELAHQWFGNLVTMEWWTHLWLKEGFAKFIEHLCVANLFPEYDIWLQFVADVTLESALTLDALHNSHPIEVPVGHPSEVTGIFDTISYRKGASIIRMLYEYIGNECFSCGLSTYLKKHSYKNTVTEDLWEALEEVSKKPIAKVMSTWTKQKGFPVISVSSRQDGNDRILTLTQEKFCLNGKLMEEEKDYLWCVPISIVTQSSPTVEVMQLLLDSKSTEVVLKNVKENEWVKLNPRCVGFYRVHYTSDMSSHFIPSVKDKSMNELDRLGVHNDLRAMVQSGKSSTVDLLKIMEAYVDEESYSVWSSIKNCLSHLSTLLSHTDFHENFNVYGRRLMEKINEKLGWNPKDNESHLDTMLRSSIIGSCVSFKNPATLSESKRLFNEYLNNDILIPADIRGSVYRAVAMDADDNVFDSMFSLYRKTDFQEEKNRLIASMTATEDPKKIQKVLEFALTDEVRSQDAYIVIIQSSLNKYGRELTWKFVQNNFGELHRRYEKTMILAYIVEYSTKYFASEEKAMEVEQFFACHPVQTAARALQQSLESIRLNSEWLSRDKDALKAYLKAYV